MTAAAAAAAAAAVSMYSATVTRTTAGPVPDDAAAKRHHVKNRKGETVGFANPHPSAGPPLTIAGNVRRMLRALFGGELVKASTENHQVKVVEPKFLPTRGSFPVLLSTEAEPLRATWLGHACYYIEFPSGLRVLFDPVFEKACAPVPGWVSFLDRFTPAPCAPRDLPFVDAVVISHSHYDHLSLPTVQALAARHPRAHFFVGLGLAKWFRSAGIAGVTELDWWDDAELRLVLDPAASSSSRANGESKVGGTEPPAKEARVSGGAGSTRGPEEIVATISCLPCQHTSGRTHSDKDTTLWASWSVSSGGHSVWFAGDTGYRAVPQPASGEDYEDVDEQYYSKSASSPSTSLPRNPDFAAIGALRGPFDLGLIPIGAYKPRWLFSPVHAAPMDAVEIFRDARCRRAIGVHWGTWVLTSEDVDEPPVLLRRALRRAGLSDRGLFDVCAIGETREF